MFGSGGNQVGRNFGNVSYKWLTDRLSNIKNLREFFATCSLCDVKRRARTEVDSQYTERHRSATLRHNIVQWFLYGNVHI